MVFNKLVIVLTYRKLYFSGRDLSAAVNLGRVFAERCLKAGIVSVFYDPNTDVHGSEKVFFFQGSISIKIKSKELCCTLLRLVVALSNNFTSIHLSSF